MNHLSSISPEYDDLKRRLQSHLADGLVLVIGSGLSVAEGVSGMEQLASYLIENVKGAIVKSGVCMAAD